MFIRQLKYWESSNNGTAERLGSGTVGKCSGSCNREFQRPLCKRPATGLCDYCTGGGSKGQGSGRKKSYGGWGREAAGKTLPQLTGVGRLCGRWEGPQGGPSGLLPECEQLFPGPGPPPPHLELSPPSRDGSGSRDQGQHGRRRRWELKCRRRRAAGGNPPASPPSPPRRPRGPERRKPGLGRHRAAATGFR